MAKDNGGSDSWPGFLTELTKSFLILRDIFGYALPGAVFLLVGLLAKKLPLSGLRSLLETYKVPLWLVVVAGVAACYTLGHLMAALAYVPFNTWRFSRKHHKTEKEKQAIAEAAAMIDIRGRHPELLTEFERQNIMTQLRGSTGVALIFAYLAFYRSANLIGLVVLLAGTFLLFAFWFSANPHMNDLMLSTIMAGELTEQAARTTGPDKSPQAEAVERMILVRAVETVEESKRPR
jgi:hypothetical protein